MANSAKSTQAYAASPRGILELFAGLEDPRFPDLEPGLQRALSHELFFVTLCDDGRELFRELSRSVRRFGTPEAFHPLYVLRFAWRASVLVGPLMRAGVNGLFEGEFNYDFEDYTFAFVISFVLGIDWHYCPSQTAT